MRIKVKKKRFDAKNYITSAIRFEILKNIKIYLFSWLIECEDLDDRCDVRDCHDPTKMHHIQTNCQKTCGICVGMLYFYI